MNGAPLVLTVGHSTRGLSDFLALLREFEVATLVDVRRFPASRRYPHFNGPSLAGALSARAIAYAHEPGLGGRREPDPQSRNRAWRVAAFRGYADHMASPEFRAALGRLRALASVGRPVVMCAEAVPWRCHRQLIADALVAEGTEVRHILGPGDDRVHALNPNARIVEGGVLVYAEAPQRSLFRRE